MIKDFFVLDDHPFHYLTFKRSQSQLSDIYEEYTLAPKRRLSISSLFLSILDVNLLDTVLSLWWIALRKNNFLSANIVSVTIYEVEMYYEIERIEKWRKNRNRDTVLIQVGEFIFERLFKDWIECGKGFRDLFQISVKCLIHNKQVIWRTL